MKKDLIGNRWDELLAGEWEKPYYRELRSFLIEEYKSGTVYPPAADIYNALRLTDYDDVKVVILGQDPYHEPGQAHGLAFSVPRGTAMPPSLVNILKELKSDLGIAYEPEAVAVESGKSQGESVSPAMDEEESPNIEKSSAANHSERPRGILEPWAKEGVLLLNTVLSVRAHQAASHAGRGWEQFTDRVIELLAQRTKPMVFVLWGAHARSKKELIIKAQTASKESPANNLNRMAQTAGNEASAVNGDSGSAMIGGEESASSGNGVFAASGNEASTASERHLIIEAPHPSPLSAHRGFFGGCYFSRCNYFLEDSGIEPVDWSL